MRYLLRAFWNEFQPTFDENVYQALCTKQVMFAEIGEDFQEAAWFVLEEPTRQFAAGAPHRERR